MDGVNSPIPSPEIRSILSGIDRREWGLWLSTIIIIFLLMLGMSSFPASSESKSDGFYSFLMDRPIYSLAGLVLIFMIYALRQQIQINRIRWQVIEQVCAVDRVEARSQEIYELAVLDSLTGLYNRRYAEKRLTDEIARTQRRRLPFTVILLDLNDFKQVNDTFGHAAGDSLLKAFAERLSKATRGSDVCARYGGDEFLVLLPECRPQDVQFVLKRLDDIKIDVGGGMQSIAYSAGCADYDPGESAEEVLKRADADLYVNKRTSKISVT
jgi:diguanylate cyclase (GGDEF)-like protein